MEQNAQDAGNHLAPRPRSNAHVLAVVLLSSALACGGDPAAPPDPPTTQVLEIGTDRTEYRDGETATVRVRNKSPDRTVAMDLCSPLLDRWEPDAWRNVRPPPGPVLCAPISRLLRPGQSVQQPYTIPPGVREGFYRLRFDELGDSAGGSLPEAERVSRPFRVR